MTASLERVFVLTPFSELRVVTSSAPKDRTRVMLHMPLRDAGDDGDLSRAAPMPRADVLGTELTPGVVVQLPISRSLPVFSPTGCTLTVTAPPAVLQRCYVTTSGATWMRSLLSLHSHLEVQRMEARAAGSDPGPRVLIVADERFVGTSTYTRMLAAYAVRLGYHPLLLDGAVEHPQFGYKGCLSLYHLQYSLDVEEETSFLPGVHLFAGGDRTRAHEGLYLHGVRALVRLGLRKMSGNDRCRVGGLFFDYGVVSTAAVEAAEREEGKAKQGSPTDEGVHSGSASVFHPLDLLLDTIMEAAIDHVFVVQSGWLRYKLAQRAHERFNTSAQSPLEQHLLTAPLDIFCDPQGVAFKLFLVDGLDYVNTVPPAVVSHQRWMHYFFGSPTSAVRPTLVTVVARIATLGSSQQSALAEMMPMMDETTAVADEEEGFGGRGWGRDGRPRGALTRKLDRAAVSFVRPQDVNLKGRIVGISSATAMEEMPDGSLREVDYVELERRVQECVLVGFALVESAGADKVTLLVNDAALRKDLGICLLLTEEYLRS